MTVQQTLDRLDNLAQEVSRLSAELSVLASEAAQRVEVGKAMKENWNRQTGWSTATETFRVPGSMKVIRKGERFQVLIRQ